jgi:IclR family transcriptional regulator, KDG regulon repressor
MSKTKPKSERRGVQSVDRAINILEVLASERSGLGIVEISQRVTLPVSSVHRLLSTLVDRHFVAQDLHTGHYRVGVGSFEVGTAFLRQVRLTDIARQHLQELSKATRETVNLALRDGDSAAYVDQVQSDRELQVMPRPGARMPLYCTGVGKVFLAGMTESQRQEVLERLDLAPRTKYTKTTVEDVLDNVREVQRMGYAVNDQELHLGVRCVAAPVLDHLGETCAAISVTGSPTHLYDEHLKFVVARLCNVARLISDELGYRPIE